MEKIPKCKTELVEACFSLPDSNEQVCRDVPKQDCTIEEVETAKQIPTTECRPVATARTICGPKICPITKKEPVCEDRLKMVS